MTTATKYETLLVQYKPRPIRTVQAYRRVLKQIDRLMKPQPTRAESELLELLATLVQQYESQEYPAPNVPAQDMLAFLIEAREVSQADVSRETQIPRSTISAVLAGRRNLSTANIARLAKYFRVSTDLFIESTNSNP